jgi:hypothetical protein
MLLRTGHRGRLLVTPARGSRGALDQPGVNAMHHKLDLRVAVIVFGAGLFLAGVTSAKSQQEQQQQQQTPNEAKEILKDSQKQDPETPKELAECLKQWGPNTQMTKEEWAASCRRTLNYFPENP